MHNDLEGLFLRIALKDDKEAFKKIFESFFAPLCIYAQRYISNQNICEDIVQEVFFNLWKKRKTLEITVSVRNFLITNVKNSCIDYLRRKEVESRYITFQSEKFNDEYDLEEFYYVLELEESMGKALSKLPEHVRTVFEMNRFKGITYSEIAKQNNISVKTVEAYVSRVLKMLRVELKEYLPIT